MLGLKIGEYYSGISSDILQFYLRDLSHGTRLVQSREKKYFLYHDGFYLRGLFITLLEVVFSWYVTLVNSISLYFTHYCIYGCTPFGFFIVLN